MAIGLIVVAAAGCASYATGHYHTVSRGENLYRIGLHYGVDARTLADVNGIDDVTSLRIGQRIWIPKNAARPAAYSGSAPVRPRDARAAARREAEREASLAFAWPVEAVSVSSRYGRRRGRNHDGIDLRAPRGARILAAEAGKVIHSGWLGDYGQVVIIKHAGSYRTVYAHARKLHVRKGDFVDRGQRIGEVGSTGNATGPHLHFEIRKGETPRDPMLYLP